MKLCCIAIFFAIYLFVTVQGQPCSCTGGCDNTTIVFPGSGGRIVDVAYGKPANMSSTYTSKEEGTSGPACLAVNGKTGTILRTLKDGNPNCVHTTATDNGIDDWWEVDLGRNHTVTNITIYRREGENNQRRMSGTHVEVDNQTCYTFPLLNDNVTALDNLSEKIDVTCTPPLTGRVVRLQKRGQEYAFWSGAHLINVCEVQIWGCADAYVGPDCQCGHCRDGARCDVTTLECHRGCDRGWGTLFCNQSCPAGTHGYDCRQQCGHCADSDTCNTVTGLCPNGCQPGWKGDDCKQICLSGSFGANCSMKCSNCSQDRCTNTDGECLEGCKPGYQWNQQHHFCNEFCQNGRYGENCSEYCGHCSGNEPCNPVNGTCASCQPQLQPPLCKVCTGNRYGASCELNCSTNCGGDGSCEKDSGSCVGECAAGYRPGESGFCNETCEEGKYGKGCSQNCGKCNGTCGHEDGRCAAGCVDGFEGDLCASEVSSPGSDVPLVAGVTVGVMVLITTSGVVLVIIIIRRRKNKPEAGSAHTQSSTEPVNGTRQTAPSVHPITGNEAPKSSKPSAAVKVMVAKKPRRGVNQKDVDHIYHNITDASAHQLSTAAPRASPAPAPTQGPGQSPANGFEPGAPAELSGHAVHQEETGAEESHVYDGLQTPDDSDRAPYTSLVLQGKQDTARNTHTYQNPAFHTSDTAHDYYNL